VAGNERLFSLRQFSFDDVEIRPADATGANSKEKLAGCELRPGSLFDLKRLLRGSEYSGFQGLWFRGYETAFDCDYASQDTALLLPIKGQSHTLEEVQDWIRTIRE